MTSSMQEIANTAISLEATEATLFWAAGAAWTPAVEPVTMF